MEAFVGAVLSKEKAGTFAVIVGSSWLWAHALASCTSQKETRSGMSSSCT